MDEKLRFIARLMEGEKMSEICREFKISRKTGYKLPPISLQHQMIKFRIIGLAISDPPRGGQFYGLQPAVLLID